VDCGRSWLCLFRVFVVGFEVAWFNMRRGRILIKILLLVFSLILLLLAFVGSYGTECYDSFLIVMSVFLIVYDILFELVSCIDLV